MHEGLKVRRENINKTQEDIAGMSGITHPAYIA
jgi:transcriptional regulator with XRE-family HTH domain